MRGAWKGYRTQSGSDIGRKAIRVFICQSCAAWFQDKPPTQCSCGMLAFDRFDSKTEAKRWATLLILQRAGKITELNRQVNYPLLTVHHETGNPINFGRYVADFVYRDTETGRTVIEDVKGNAISPEAKLKLRIMEASGRTVTLI